ncbi:hypothetical protein bcCo53_000929 (plasmid) [Borrelia coriaceae]|nr:hypothetical protein bcCo53_000929 [Borrelia coriaceae]
MSLIREYLIYIYLFNKVYNTDINVKNIAKHIVMIITKTHLYNLNVLLISLLLISILLSKSLISDFNSFLTLSIFISRLFSAITTH